MDWIENIVSQWKGHRSFANWLVQKKQPTLIVDIGVDYGYSTFSFAHAQKKACVEDGITVGIDMFTGDRQTFPYVQDLMQKHEVDNLGLVIGDADEVGESWKVPADIIHIDALHTYDAVKKNFESWIPHLKADGVMLIHNVYCTHKFFNEIDLPKAYFTHSAGLGILSRDVGLIQEIIKEFPEVCTQPITAQELP